MFANETAVTDKRLTWREPLAVLATVVLVDATVYHGIGFTGIALLVCVLPLLFFFGVAKPLLNFRTVLFAVLALLVSMRLIWCGNPSAAFIGLIVVFLFAALQTGTPLDPWNLIVYWTSGLFPPPSNFADYYQSLKQRKSTGWTLDPARQAAIFVPFALLIVFGTIFVFANPDLQERVQHYWHEFLDWTGRFADWIPTLPQVLVWFAAVWGMIGLLRPKNGRWSRNLYEMYYDSFRGAEPTQVAPFFVEVSDDAQATKLNELPQENVPKNEVSPNCTYYYAYFNSLVSLSLLFGVYLIFECYKNWTRNFPSGFNYSQHMHQGAAYLTLALALSTLVLCTIFRPKTLLDPRIRTLKRLAVLWTGLNFLLAFAVYNRLYIYIDLNGLSWLRILGLLGTTAVVLGLVMVVRMILLSRGILWLIYRYTWSVLAIAFIGHVFPFGWCISHHNVSRVMKDDLLPSIFLFPDSLDQPEHLLASLPLLESEDEIIREGAKAFFADYLVSQTPNPDWGYRWTAFQWSHNILQNALEPHKEALQTYLINGHQRKQAIEAFRKHTHRWI